MQNRETARNDAIYKEAFRGDDYGDIARRHGITRALVSGIVSRMAQKITALNYLDSIRKEA